MDTLTATRTVRVKVLPALRESHTVQLIGDAGGSSLITGEVYESGVHLGMSAIETEHGTVYLEARKAINVVLDRGVDDPADGSL